MFTCLLFIYFFHRSLFTYFSSIVLIICRELLLLIVIIFVSRIKKQNLTSTSEHVWLILLWTLLRCVIPLVPTYSMAIFSSWRFIHTQLTLCISLSSTNSIVWAHFHCWYHCRWFDKVFSLSKNQIGGIHAKNNYANPPWPKLKKKKKNLELALAYPEMCGHQWNIHGSSGSHCSMETTSVSVHIFTHL